MSEKAAVVYYYRGLTERGTGEPGYRWVEGWSENSAEGKELFPWMTRRECLAEARSNGVKALFVRLDTTKA